MKKFKVGDRVRIKDVNSEIFSGKRFIVERVDSDINTFEPDKWI